MVKNLYEAIANEVEEEALAVVQRENKLFELDQIFKHERVGMIVDSLDRFTDALIKLSEKPTQVTNINIIVTDGNLEETAEKLKSILKL